MPITQGLPTRPLFRFREIKKTQREKERESERDRERKREIEREKGERERLGTNLSKI